MAEQAKETFLPDLLSGYTRQGKSAVFLDEIRKQAVAEVSALSFPTTRDEEWKYVNLRPMLKNQFSVVPSGDISSVNIDELAFPEAENVRLVFVNGVYSDELSSVSDLPDGVIVGNLTDYLESHEEIISNNLNKHAKSENDVFTAFNTGLFNDAAFIFVPKNTQLSAPVHLLFVNTNEAEPLATAPRLLLIGERNAEMTLIEDHIGLGDNVYFSTAVAETALAENAHFTHIKLQRESKKAYHISRIAASIQKDSEYHSYSVHLGAKISRSDVMAILKDQNTHATLDGLVMVNEDQHSDTHSIMDHTMPNCTSHQLHKCIVDGEGTSTFNGKIFVRKDAQKTDAFQENRNLQLSEKGTVNTKPQLEIFADDVSCSHGATVGQLDDEQMFYLKSRGVSEQKSKEILTYGFALDVIESIPVKSIQERLSKEVAKYTNLDSVVGQTV